MSWYLYIYFNFFSHRFEFVVIIYYFAIEPKNKFVSFILKGKPEVSG